MKTWPNLAYCGLPWACNTGVKDSIAKNVTDVIEGYIKGAMTAGSDQAPALDEAKFAVAVAMNWQDLVAAHNKEFNQVGRLYANAQRKSQWRSTWVNSY